MSNNVLDDQTPAGGGGTPTATPSSGQPGSLPLDASAVAAALKADVIAALSKDLQSAKDKRIDKVASRQDAIEAAVNRLEELTQGGLSKKAALRVMALEDAAEEASTVTPVSPAVGPVSEPAAVELSVLLQATGLDANDPEVLNVIRAGGDPTSRLVAVAAKRKTQTPAAPNAATVQPTGPAAPVPPPDLQAKWEAERKAMLDNPYATADQKAQLRRKYRNLGLNI